MIIDEQRLQRLLRSPPKTATVYELRREENVFFVGGELPGRETVETIFESHCQAPAVLFHLTFGTINSFHLGEELARLIKKNFNAYVIARIDWPAPPAIIDRAYGAGVDILDIPLRIHDSGLSQELGLERDKRLQALNHARSVFPAWGVISTLVAGEEAPCSTISGIDLLLKSGITPFVETSGRCSKYQLQEIAEIFRYLQKGWNSQVSTIKPLSPLIEHFTPFAPAQPRSLITSLFSRFHDRRLLASSDLRRVLRVRQVEDSFQSAGL
jgi:hypothetical protein